MNCPNCHAENPAENGFCGKCGAPIDPERIPRYNHAHTVKREVFIILGGISLLLASVVIAYVLFFRGIAPDAIVQGFIEADKSGNLSAENQYVTTSAASRMMLSMMQTMRGAAGTSPFQNYRITRSYGDPQNAMVDVEVTFANPAPRIAGTPPPPPNKYQLTFFLVRENSQWKIDPVQTTAGLTGMLMAMGMQQLQTNFFGPNGGLNIPNPLAGPGFTTPNTTAPQPVPKSGSGLL